jgi:hypothetical protein
MIRRCLVAATVAGLFSVLASSAAAQVHAQGSTSSGVTTQTLARGPVKSRPVGDVFMNILEFHQVPGSAWLPQAFPTIVYTLHGVTTVSSPHAAARSVTAGTAAFTTTLSVPANDDVQGRFGTGAIAVGLILVALLLCAATWLRGGVRRGTFGALSVLLIAGGVLVLTGATANDWYVFAVRPELQRSVAMPRPDGHVVLNSPDMDSKLPAPYVETLSAITVSPGVRDVVVDVPAEMIIVVQGNAAVQVGDATQQLGDGGAAFAQAGNTLAIANSGSDTLQVLAFAVTPVSAVPPAA